MSKKAATKESVDEVFVDEVFTDEIIPQAPSAIYDNHLDELATLIDIPSDLRPMSVYNDALKLASSAGVSISANQDMSAGKHEITAAMDGFTLTKSVTSKSSPAETLCALLVEVLR